MFIKKTILAVVAVVVTNVNPTIATRGIRRAESESLESRDTSTSIIDNGEIYSLIDEQSFMDDVAQFTLSPSPTHDSKLGSCVYAKDDDKLRGIIGNANDGDEIYLCPGKVSFSDEIVLTKGITIACAGPKGSCIFDGNGVTRHFRSETSDLTFNFVRLVFLNGLADDASLPVAGEGGSVFFKNSFIIFDHCLFYNNQALAKVPNGSVFGGAIYTFNGDLVINNCVFLNNVAEASSVGSSAGCLSEGVAFGGAIESLGQSGSLTVLDSIFKNNKAIQVRNTDTGGGGGAISVNPLRSPGDVLVLSSVFELNEATNVGGAIQLLDSESALNANLINNKELLFGNDANLCKFGAVTIPGGASTCFRVEENGPN